MNRPIPAPPPDPDLHRGCLARGVTCGCIGCGGLFFLLGIAFVLVSSVPNPVALTVATIAAVLPVPTYAFLILQLDRYEHEPWRLLLAAFLWGALVATLFAAILNDLIGYAVAASLGEQMGHAITLGAIAPIVEEAAKGSALILLFLVFRSEFDNTLDGIVYGSLIGL